MSSSSFCVSVSCRGPKQGYRQNSWNTVVIRPNSFRYFLSHVTNQNLSCSLVQHFAFQSIIWKVFIHRIYRHYGMLHMRNLGRHYDLFYLFALSKSVIKYKSIHFFLMQNNVIIKTHRNNNTISPDYHKYNMSWMVTTAWNPFTAQTTFSVAR